MPPPRISARRPHWNGWPTWKSKPAPNAPLSGASDPRACRPSPASTLFISSITRAVCRPNPASCACSISHSSPKEPTSCSSEILAWAKHSWPSSWHGAPAKLINDVLFTTAMDMLNHLLASQVDHSLVRKLKAYTEPSLLVCDELGYLALDQQTSNLFYQVISTRHSHKRSTVITTNTPFSDWGNILFNTTIATAIADRLVENSEIFLLGGDSLRKANKNPEPPAE